MELEERISSHVHTCFNLFTDTRAAFFTATVPPTTSEAQLSLVQKAIVECEGRFRVWSGNVGAHQMGKSSLDYRLRDALYVKPAVVRLLVDLNELMLGGKYITCEASVNQIMKCMKLLLYCSLGSRTFLEGELNVCIDFV